jgi:hypothetical protein
VSDQVSERLIREALDAGISFEHLPPPRLGASYWKADNSGLTGEGIGLLTRLLRPYHRHRAAELRQTILLGLAALGSAIAAVASVVTVLRG